MSKTRNGITAVTMASTKFLSDKSFEEWCSVKPHTNPTTTLQGKSVKTAHDDPALIYDNNFNRKITETAGTALHVRLHTPHEFFEFKIDLADRTDLPSLEKRFRLDGEKLSSDIASLTLGELIDVKIANTILGKIDFRVDPSKAHLGEVSLKNCIVWELHVPQNANTVIRIEGCRIGTLRLDNSATRNLVIENCRIHNFELTPPALGCPLTGGSHIASNCTFPTAKSAIYPQRDQGYRNLREALEKMGDSQQAHRIRALEMATERHDDNGPMKMVGVFYGLTTDNGLSIGRPALLFIVVWAITICIGAVDGGIPNPAIKDFAGWRAALEFSGGTVWARSAVMVTENTNPMGLLSRSPRLIIPDSAWMSIVLTLQTMFNYLMIFFVGVTIRRRFKIAA